MNFSRLASATATAMGHWIAFTVAFTIILVWGITGPLFHFTDTWQLVINTGTTIVTFLMVFLIQHDANRSDHAMHLKLDEIIHALDKANNSVIGAEKDDW